jgi:hypothetical protein
MASLASRGLSVFDSWKWIPGRFPKFICCLMDGFANGAAVSDMTIECGVVAFVSSDHPVFTGIGIYRLRMS